jgi:hypothetical protein
MTAVRPKRPESQRGERRRKQSRWPGQAARRIGQLLTRPLTGAPPLQAVTHFNAGLDPAAAVQTLAVLAGQPAVEFGIGTGRLALPLAEVGLDVHGTEGSRR